MEQALIFLGCFSFVAACIWEHYCHKPALGKPAFAGMSWEVGGDEEDAEAGAAWGLLWGCVGGAQGSRGGRMNALLAQSSAVLWMASKDREKQGSRQEHWPCKKPCSSAHPAAEQQSCTEMPLNACPEKINNAKPSSRLHTM